MLIFSQISAVISVVVVILADATTAKVYKKCELAKELSEVHRMEWEDVATYVCIAERQSNFNTQAVGEGLYYGMYQMSSEFWCDKFSVGKACNLNCNNLIDDNISDDLRCMKTIIDEHERISGNGFNAWPSGRQCQSLGTNYIAECSIESNQVHSTYNNNKKAISQQKTRSGNVGRGKVYERCELARELRFKHNIQMDHIATWVCIAKHESNFNTSAIGRLNWDGSEDHGLFQISDLYWCGESGKACGLTCDELEDNDISNDVECIKTIHAEHTRLFGDGFQAWAVYPRCRGQSESYISGCFDDSDNEIIPFKPLPGIQQPSIPKQSHHHRISSAETGKVYDRCELALELRDKHKLPINQIATWVCIAKHESNFNTSAIGRLNGDGSEDHGLFQISDLYWCGADGKGCSLTCDELEDSDIANDVECIKTIHAEHTRLFGDGFQAWAVYPRCKGQSDSYIDGCFDESPNEIIPFTPKPGVQQPKIPYTKIINQRKHYNKITYAKGKVYERCELAQELRFKHKIPMEQVATWVCIAKHESNFNTSAIGRLNYDGSEDHGLFQISDIYWCSTTGQGKNCNLACSDLEDNDITDDVECMLKIHEEHKFLSGDGFNAWAVYKPHCKGRAESYMDGCFSDDLNFIQNVKPAITQPTKPFATKKTTQKITTNPTYSSTISTRAKSYEITTIAEEIITTTEKSYDTTFYDRSTSKTTTRSDITTQNTASHISKPINAFIIQQKTNVPSSTKGLKNYYGSSTTIKPTTKQNKRIYDDPSNIKTTTAKPYQVSSINKSISSSSFTKSTSVIPKNTSKKTTTKTPQTSRAIITTTTATRRPITQFPTTAVRKSITPFDVFSFYLKDFSSKPQAFEYKPIQFSDKSTVIFKKSDISTNVQVPGSTISLKTTQKPLVKSNLINDEKSLNENLRTTTARSPSIFDFIPAHYTSSSIVKGFDHNRIGRVVDNITPHSFDYLLKLTTPRTFYG